jgi:putative membrane protein
MHIGRRYKVFETLGWSRSLILIPLAWSALLTGLHELAGWDWLSIPWLPLSAVAVAVAFYLGFKNNASYDRMWEARKIWGAIVNSSRSWAFSARDLVTDAFPDHGVADEDDLRAERVTLVHRQIAWLDALRYQLRRVQTWEHHGAAFDRLRVTAGVPEYDEDLREVLAVNLASEELEEVLSQINPSARLLANQSRHLATLRARRLLDPFSHMQLQDLLVELMAHQGKAERIKGFPFPRQYATVNHFFAVSFCALVPLGMLEAFEQLEAGVAVWATIPFSALVSWVFLTTDRIGDWSENPFEGLSNDVPISAIARGIERDVRQLVDETELPPARQPSGSILY